MQVNKQDIQRPRLIEPFLNKELTPSNDFVTYIDCTYTPSNIVHKKDSATSKSHNSKKALKNENIFRAFDSPLFKRCPIFLQKSSFEYIFVIFNSEAIIFIKPDTQQHHKYYELHDNFSIFDHRNYITSA